MLSNVKRLKWPEVPLTVQSMTHINVLKTILMTSRQLPDFAINDDKTDRQKLWTYGAACNCAQPKNILWYSSTP